jgi:hypothetical protein
MILTVYLDDDGLNRGVTLHENTYLCEHLFLNIVDEKARGTGHLLPLMARGMLSLSCNLKDLGVEYLVTAEMLWLQYSEY